MSDASYVLTDSQLHRYLADAWREGADSEKSEPILDREEAFILSEHHAREFVRLRVENGLLVTTQPTESPSEDGPDEFLMQLKGGRSILYRKVLGLDRPTERDLEKARANLDRDDVQVGLSHLVTTATRQPLKRQAHKPSER